MNIEDRELMDQKISKAVCKAIEQLIQDFKNEPTLILEGDNQPVDEENTLREIRAWLFRRRQENGDTSN
ncbi:MAG: hypothetical protein WBB97_11050 [Dehalococcoidales bacterium]